MQTQPQPKSGTKRKRALGLASDSEASAALHHRLRRLRLECCVCMEEGWLVSEETAPHAQRTMHLAACEDGEHATCNACLSKEAARLLLEATERRPHAGGERPCKLSIPCLFPFAAARCEAAYRWGAVRKVAPPDALARFLDATPSHLASRIQADGESAVLPCPSCGAGSAVPLETLALAAHHVCAGCRVAWCTRCERVAVPPFALCPCHALPDEAVPAAFSRFLTHPDGWPKRKREARAKEVHAFFDAACAEKGGWHHVACPDCRMGLYKSSACNDLTHCARHICNVCSCASFPWEAHLPATHWDKMGVTGCPQWDYDAHWNGGAGCGFQCVEGTCYGDGHECTVTTHQPGIQAMHASRRQKTFAALAREFGHVVARRDE